MDSAFLYIVSKASVKENEINVSVKLEDMPVIDKNITEEEKKEIAYEVLKRMKAKRLIRFFVYTEDSGEENVPDRTINLV